MKQVGLDNKLMDSLDEIYNKFGNTKLALGASMMPYRTWNMTRNQLSQNYFKWDQLLCVK
jgi:DNA polymerase V